MPGSTAQKAQTQAVSSNPKKRRNSSVQAVKETAASSRPKRVATAVKKAEAEDAIDDAKKRPKSSKVKSESAKDKKGLTATRINPLPMLSLYVYAHYIHDT